MKISRNIIFNYFLIGILFWIGGYNILEDFVLSLLLTFCVIIIAWIICFRYRQIFLCIIFLFFGVFLWTGVATYDATIKLDNMTQLSWYYGLYNEYEWQVQRVDKRTDYYDEYKVRITSVNHIEMEWEIVHLLRVPKNFILKPYQVINYSGKMYALEDFDGFSYHKFMLSQDIYFSTSANSINHISHNNSQIGYKMFVLREALLTRISDIFPGREAIFLWGILFWARENIPGELKEDFNNSWLTHFIAVSGFNITLCIIFISYIFAFFPVYIRSMLVVLSIIAFSFFVWLWAPVVRAAIMWILGYIFLQSWNKWSTITLVLFTAVVMTLLSPLSLNYDVSLHLSFLAVIGIIYTQEILTQVFSKLPSIFAIREAFVLTLSALSFSLPIMMFQFGQVSLLAPIANIAITWTIPLAMLLGTITLIVDFISPIAGQWFWFVTWILLRYDIAMVELFWNIDSALLKTDFWVYSNYLQAIYFILLTYILALYHMKKKTSEKQSETTISKLKQSNQF